MQGLKKPITIGDKTLTARELTFGEIRQWEKEVEESIANSSASVADMLLMEHFSVSDLSRMTDVPMEYLSDFTPSQLDEIYRACLEVNGRFFVLRAVLVKPLRVAAALASSI